MSFLEGSSAMGINSLVIQKFKFYEFILKNSLRIHVKISLKVVIIALFICDNSMNVLQQGID